MLALALATLLPAALRPTAQEPAPVRVPAYGDVLNSMAQADEWASAHQTFPHESPWTQRPWEFDLAGGVERAWSESAPLALWLGDGHPFGAASAADLALRAAWRDAAVAAASRGFALAADDARELAAARAASPELDAWLARASGGAEPGPGTILFVAPDGAPLGAAAPVGAAALAEAFRAAAAAWQAAGGAADPAAAPESPPPFAPFARRADGFPLDGIALLTVHRECADPSAGAPELLEGPWCADTLWFGREDAAALAPARTGLARGAWPEEAARRLALLALSDSSAGRARDFVESGLRRAEIELHPQAMRQGRRAFRLRGRFIAEHGGAWRAEEGAGDFGAGEWTASESGGRRARARLEGWMETDTATGALIALRATALVQTVDAAGVRHHVFLARRLPPTDPLARVAPSDGNPPDAPPLLRALWAESLPQEDGALDDVAWRGVPWSRPGPGGERVSLIWNSDRLWIAAWSPAPGLRLRIGGAEVSVGADGAAAGTAGAAAAARARDGGWSCELTLPWSGLAEAGCPAPPAAEWLPLALGEEAPAAARILLEPSKAGSFAPSGGGFR